MNTTPIRPARIVFDADGTPRSAEHDDVYHPRDGALAQARHVFLDGGALATRWHGRERFVVLETGFGLGNNFLATWDAWRNDPGRCRRLHFLSIDDAPPSRGDLATVARDAELAPLADALAAQWPPLTCNLHRLTFDGGAVELLLAFGDVAAWMPQLVTAVDAFFLDGFAPARNPAMWDARVLKAMARLAAPGATVATWSAARSVRDALVAAGFAVEAATGHGAKRDITRARYAPRHVPHRHGRTSQAVPAVAHGDRHDVVIVGAGMAGCALAAALAEQGRRSLVLERTDDVATRGSGNAAALFHGIVHRHDGRHARWYRAAALAAAAAVGEAIARHGVHGKVGGLLRLAPDAAGRDELQATIDALGLPDDYVRAVDAAVASGLAGVPISAAAWHFPHAGWVDPRGLARAWLADAGALATLKTGRAVAALVRVGEAWELRDANGASIARAACVALCNAGAAFDLLDAAAWPIAMERGQISSIDAGSLPVGSLPRLPLAGAGYAVAADDGKLWFGASTTLDDDDRVHAGEHVANLERLRRLIGLAVPVDVATLGGRAAFRWQSGDRLPVIGSVPAALAGPAVQGMKVPGSPRLDQPRFIARAPGLFICAALGSRGIASSVLGGRIVAAAIAGAPAPVEADLLDAVDPARFLVRRFRRGEHAPAAAAPSFVQPPLGPMAGAADS